MDRVPVDSSNLASIGYDESTQTLEIEFKNGGLYQYFDVPASVHTELLGSDSLGSYFSHQIRSSYRYTRM